MASSTKRIILQNLSLRLIIVILTVVAFVLTALAGYSFDKNVTVFWFLAIVSIAIGTLAPLLSEKHLEEHINAKIKASESRLKTLIEDMQKKERKSV